VGPLETVRYKNTASEVDCAISFGTAASSSGGTIANVKTAVIKLP
jgi:ribosomal protein S27E